MPPPLSLYVHLPWCARKCPYCDFNSHRAPARVPEEAYVQALLGDLEAEGAHLGQRSLVSVFIGGGTPSLFSPEAVAGLLDGIRARVGLAPECEVTLEANPGTLERGRLRGYREAGVGRLSLGVQSFDDASLRAIGRIHDARDAHRAVEEARRAGFDELNLDLMHGLPGQQADGALADLAAALAHEPTHLSHYQLTLEPGTPFHRAPPVLPGEDVLADIRERSAALLASRGLEHYEVSAWSRPGHRSVHNLNYWRFGDYAGIGAGAHGKLTGNRPGQVERTCRERHPGRYLAEAGASAPRRNARPVPAADLPFEFMLNAARLVHGFEVDLFGRRTGLPADRVIDGLAAAAERGLVELDGERVRPTPRGLRFVDDLVASFLPAPGGDRAGVL